MAHVKSPSMSRQIFFTVLNFIENLFRKILEGINIPEVIYSGSIKNSKILLLHMLNHWVAV